MLSLTGRMCCLAYRKAVSWALNHICKLFADDSKLIGIIRNTQDSITLQSDIEKLVQWADDWFMQFNGEKCKVMYIGNTRRPKHPYTMESANKLERHTLQETIVE